MLRSVSVKRSLQCRVSDELKRTVSQGQWIYPETNFYLACCDCGLVHRLEFQVKHSEVRFRAFSAKAQTEIRRRQRKHWKRTDIGWRLVKGPK